MKFLSRLMLGCLIAVLFAPVARSVTSQDIGEKIVKLIETLTTTYQVEGTANYQTGILVILRCTAGSCNGEIIPYFCVLLGNGKAYCKRGTAFADTVPGLLVE